MILIEDDHEKMTVRDRNTESLPCRDIADCDIADPETRIPQRILQSLQTHPPAGTEGQKADCRPLRSFETPRAPDRHSMPAVSGDDKIKHPDVIPAHAEICKRHVQTPAGGAKKHNPIPAPGNKLVERLLEVRVVRPSHSHDLCSWERTARRGCQRVQVADDEVGCEAKESSGVCTTVSGNNEVRSTCNAMRERARRWIAVAQEESLQCHAAPHKVRVRFRNMFRSAPTKNCDPSP